MNIYIDKVSSRNLGAWMMAEAIIQLASSENPEMVFSIDPYRFQSEHISLFHSAHRKSVLKLCHSRLFMGKSHFHVSAKYVARRNSEIDYASFGLMSMNEVDVVLNAGGFWLGHPWFQDSSKLNQTINHYKHLRKNGKKIILMPQAFGVIPKHSQSQYAELFEECSLVFARDVQSAENVKAVCNRNKIHVCPDFTIKFKPQQEKWPQKFDFVVIPNVRLIEHTSMTFDSLISMFAIVCMELLKHGTVCVANHAQDEDLDIVEAIAHKANVEFVHLTCPSQAKSMLSKSQVVFSGRYHGLLNALYSAVPVVTVSWSHKYEEVMREFGMGGYCLAGEQLTTTNIIRSILELQRNRTKIVEKLQIRIDDIDGQIDQMWRCILDILE